MKKLLALCVALVMILSMSSVAFADGAFDGSPSAKPAPEIEGKNESEDCEAMLIITAYTDRQDLSTKARMAIEDAYKEIEETEDISKINNGEIEAAVKALAASYGIKTSDLAVSELFDISSTHCGDHEGHGHFDITLKPEDLENFVCLLHFYNGEWRIVDNAKVTNNGTHIEFDEKEFSPFAIVVSKVDLNNAGGSGEGTDDDKGSPNTGDENDITLYAVVGTVALVAAAAVAVFATKKTKKSN